MFMLTWELLAKGNKKNPPPPPEPMSGFECVFGAQGWEMEIQGYTV